MTRPARERSQHRRSGRRLRRRLRSAEWRPDDRGGDAGMATAEYAIATLAACGFAALLVTILRSGEVQGLLLGIVRHALSLGG
jgi:hypothetical protein